MYTMKKKILLYYRIDYNKGTLSHLCL